MLKFKLISPERIVVQEDVLSITFPSIFGYLDPRLGHIPLLAEMKPGCVTLVDKEKVERKYFVSGGYAHLSGGNTIVLLADEVERKDEIDKKRAEKAMKRATERLENTSNHSIQIERALLAQEKARERIKICD